MESDLMDLSRYPWSIRKNFIIVDNCHSRVRNASIIDWLLVSGYVVSVRGWRPAVCREVKGNTNKIRHKIQPRGGSRRTASQAFG